MKSPFFRNYRFNSVFLRLLLVLVISSIVPVLLANWIIYKKSTAAIDKQIRNANLEMLDKTLQLLELIYGEMDQTIQQVANDVNVVQAVVCPGIDHYSRNVNIINSLRNVAASNRYIHSIYVYSLTDGVIRHSNGSIYHIETFIDRDWLKEYKEAATPFFFMDTRDLPSYAGGRDKVVTLVANLVYQSGSKLGAVVVNIKEDELYRTTAGSLLQGGSEIFAVNAAGRIVSHKNKRLIDETFQSGPSNGKILSAKQGFFLSALDGKPAYFTFMTSERTRWKYVYTVPSARLAADSETVALVILLITAVYIVLSLIVSFLVTRGVYNPIEKLINIVSAAKSYSIKPSAAGIKNEYDFLGHAYENVVNECESMEQRLEQLKPLIKEKLFINLIRGMNVNLKEVTEKLAFLNIPFGLKNFVVLLVQIDEYGDLCERYDEMERNLQKVGLLCLVEKIIAERQRNVCLEIEPDKIIAVVNFDEGISLKEAQEQAAGFAEAVKAKVAEAFPFTATLGIGRMYEDLLNIDLSYAEAEKALRYKLYQGKNSIIDINALDTRESELYYSHSERERAIIGNIKIGNQGKVEILVAELMGEIQRSGAVPNQYIRQIFMNIVSSMVEVVIGMGSTVEDVFGKDSNLYDELVKKDELSEIEDWILKISGILTAAVNEFNNKRIDRNVEKILEYINNRLGEDLSLNDVSRVVGFCPSYVSRIFKENLGKSFTEYLNEKRVEKAKHYLRETNFSVKEVGFKVGFNNMQSFLRSFKRLESITPGQFKDVHFPSRTKKEGPPPTEQVAPRDAIEGRP